MIIQHKNVIIVGGGIAGIGAAIDLSKHHNIHVTLLEARDCLGGRISTHWNLISLSHESNGLVPQGSSDIAFDFGASWIHGVDSSNPIYPLVKAGHVEYVHTDSDLMFLQPSSPPLFEDESNNCWKIVWDILDVAQEYATEYRDRIPEDMSLRDWLDHYVGAHQSEGHEGEKYMSKLMKMAVHELAMYWADENAIPMEKVSMKYMDAEDIFPGEHSLVTNGYDRMVKALTSQLKDARVLLEHVVDKIEYSGELKQISPLALIVDYCEFEANHILLFAQFFHIKSEVKVSTNHGTFTADEVPITLPLGVLKSQSSSLFSPVLPISKQHAINNLGFGTMFKIFLFFPTCFWPEDKHFINFLPSSFTKQPNAKLVSRFNLNSRQVEALTVYMQDLANYSSFMPIYNKPILVGYATNQAAELMERLSDEEARMVYICQLSHYYDILLSNKPDREESLWPKISFMSRWNQDPFARGSYTSIPVGASTSDIEEFQIPVTARAYGTLAGDDGYEHCDIESNLVDPPVAVLTSVNDTEGGRVFFAGEHTSSGHFASVQGALMSGRLAAAKILGQCLI